MDASIPPLLSGATVAPAVPRWLTRVNFGAALLCLLWTVPTWFIVSDMFASIPVEIRPPSALTYVFIAMPAIAGIALIVAGSCLARRRGYVLCMLASAATFLAGPVLIVGLLNIIQLMRPPVKAAFGRSLS